MKKYKKHSVSSKSQPQGKKSLLIFVSTAPFGQSNAFPLEMLRANEISYRIHNLRRKLTEIELMEIAGNAEAIMAVTEPITKRVMEKCRLLRHISRVGVGLDNVVLLEAKKKRHQCFLYAGCSGTRGGRIDRRFDDFAFTENWRSQPADASGQVGTLHGA